MGISGRVFMIGGGKHVQCLRLTSHDNAAYKAQLMICKKLRCGQKSKAAHFLTDLFILPFPANDSGTKIYQFLDPMKLSDSTSSINCDAIPNN